MTHKMREFFKKVLWLACFVIAGDVHAARADANEPVQFESAAVTPTPFQLRIAQQAGKSSKLFPARH